MFWICAGNSDIETGMLYCWAGLALCQDLFCSLPQQWVSWGCSGSSERRQTGQLTTTDQWDIPHCLASCSAEEGETFGVTIVNFPSPCYSWWQPTLLGITKHLLGHGSCWRNSLFCFACVPLLFHLLNSLYLKPQAFFSSSSIFPHSTEGASEQLVVLVAGWS